MIDVNKIGYVNQLLVLCKIIGSFIKTLFGYTNISKLKKEIMQLI